MVRSHCGMHFINVYYLLINVSGSVFQLFCFKCMQGVEICLERPWRRETMHNLVKEATGIDFTEFGSDLNKAKDVTLSSLNMGSSNQEANSIGACQSIGHVLNEVSLHFLVQIQTLHLVDSYRTT